MTEAAVQTFSTLGCSVEAASPNTISPEQAYSTYVSVRLGTALQSKMEEWKEQIDRGLVRFIERNANKSAVEYTSAFFKLLKYWERIWSFFEKYNLLLTPTVAVPPFELDSFGSREIAESKVSPLSWMSFTYPFNIAGQPAASVPCGWTDDDLPVGLQIVVSRFDDVLVLKAAAAFEQASP